MEGVKEAREHIGAGGAVAKGRMGVVKVDVFGAGNPLLASGADPWVIKKLNGMQRGAKRGNFIEGCRLEADNRAKLLRAKLRTELGFVGGQEVAVTSHDKSVGQPGTRVILIGESSM